MRLERIILGMAALSAASCGSGNAGPSAPAQQAQIAPAVQAAPVAQVAERAAAPSAPVAVAPAQPAEPEHEAFSRVTIPELEAKIAAGNVYVFDNNHRETYEHGHIPGAKWVDHDHVTAADLPADHSALLVFYCANEMCSACHDGAESAISLGYTNVAILPAGIQGWVAAGKRVVTGSEPA